MLYSDGCPTLLSNAIFCNSESNPESNPEIHHTKFM